MRNTITFELVTVDDIGETDDGLRRVDIFTIAECAAGHLHPVRTQQTMTEAERDQLQHHIP